MIEILIADDHAMFADGLESILEGQEEITVKSTNLVVQLFIVNNEPTNNNIIT